jgi:hypothetical protein
MSCNAKVSATLQYPPEAGIPDIQIPKLVDIVGFTKKVDSTYQLGIATAVVLDLDSITSPKALYMTTDKAITVYLNDQTAGITLSAGGILVVAGGPTAISSIKVDVTVAATTVRLWAVE